MSQNSDDIPDDEADRLRDEVIRRMAKTPPNATKEQKQATETKKPPTKVPKS